MVLKSCLKPSGVGKRRKTKTVNISPKIAQVEFFFYDPSNATSKVWNDWEMQWFYGTTAECRAMAISNRRSFFVPLPLSDFKY